ncbi:MAG: lactate racemase domain-containing protein, partial [Anaerolineae bacterium]|nr:lactate racemase domain-containing protein [Anaerolineae bacterium]
MSTLDLVVAKGSTEEYLDEEQVRALTAEALAQLPLDGKRVLVIVPDGTRTSPTPLFFRLFYEELHGRVAALDYLVALGTHQRLSDEALHRL